MLRIRELQLAHRTFPSSVNLRGLAVVWLIGFLGWFRVLGSGSAGVMRIGRISWTAAFVIVYCGTDSLLVAAPSGRDL